uniref:Retrovirus-related Pol polyprotein from transposon TNT 1-94 n=1 Tax=Cajanus cajan TaxID=3821 RepID=A0A151U039_CAJCA|nr:Retrovirus-related Pol polyprotein from transposon TNT 1-94 [Cajanus cajan]
MDDRRSTFRACIFFLYPILFLGGLKADSCSSIVEVEYHSLTLATSKILWIQYLLNELQVHIQTSILYCDNQSIIALSHNPIFHSRTKNMGLDIFFVREKVLNKSLIVSYAPSQV